MGGGIRDISVTGKWSATYRHIIKEFFRTGGVYYWEMGGVVLIRTLTWLDWPVFHESEKLLNIDVKSVFALGMDRYVRSADGRVLDNAASREGKWIAGRVYRVPDHVKALRDPETGRYDTGSCEYVYAIVTGKPAPPEYRER